MTYTIKWPPHIQWCKLLEPQYTPETKEFWSHIAQLNSAEIISTENDKNVKIDQ